MKKELLFSGIGGQGVMNLGETLCSAAIRAGYNATFSPTYGAAKRGGRTMCQIIISTEVECQIVSKADLMLIMDDSSLLDYQGLMGEDGVLVLSTLVDEVPACRCRKVLRVPFIEKAQELGNSKTANMIALGYLAPFLDFIPYEFLQDEVRKTFAAKEKLIPLNLEALKLGYELGKNAVSAADM